MKQFIHAISLTPEIKSWLTHTLHPCVLHIFDRACNLINERGHVLSIVTQQIGNGPFNLVLEEDVSFSGHLRVESPISIMDKQLMLGNLTIHTGNAQLWNPCPDWENLHDHRDRIVHQITQLPFTIYQLPNSLPSSLALADLPSSLIAAQKLAGLGVGLTPAGDDFMMGAIYAAWIIHPVEVVSGLSQEIVNIAAPLTTSLSAAWLRASGRGEAGVLWHEFFDALISSQTPRIQETTNNILAVGETSGADALTGFMSVFTSWKEKAGFSHE
jgi:hypothetical protein